MWGAIAAAIGLAGVVYGSKKGKHENKRALSASEKEALRQKRIQRKAKREQKRQIAQANVLATQEKQTQQAAMNQYGPVIVAGGITLLIAFLTLSGKK